MLLLGSAERILGPLTETWNGYPVPEGLYLQQLVCHFPFPQRNFVCLGPGFSTELDRVKNLPYCETETFEVKFDPQGASLPVGNKEVILPIKVRCNAGPSSSSPTTSSACLLPLG